MYDWTNGVVDALKRMNRTVKARGPERISDMNVSHRELCQRASDIFDSIRDEAAIDPDHGNGTGAIIKQNVSTIRGYLSTLDQLADRITSVEGDRQDAYDETPARAWYQRGERSMSRKYNHNHDPDDGRFTTGDGDGSGGGMTGDASGSPIVRDYDRGRQEGYRFMDQVRQFERDHGISVVTASPSQLEAAMQAEWDRSGTDGAGDFIRLLAMVYGGRPPWQKRKSTSPPGAHQAYK